MNRQYDEQMIRFLYQKQRVKGLALATNNWTTFGSAWNRLHDEITDICLDAFDYRVGSITRIPTLEFGLSLSMDLCLYHSHWESYESIEEMSSLKNLTIVNFQWAFDDDAELNALIEGSSEPGTISGRIADTPRFRDSLLTLKLIGDVFYKVAHEDEMDFEGNEEQRKQARAAVTSKFRSGTAAGTNVDISWMRFKYLNEQDWDNVMRPGPIDRNARARFRFEVNDIPAFNRHPPWETWDEIKQWKEVEVQGWKVYENTEGYPVIIGKTRMLLDVSLANAGFDGTLEEKMAAWSAKLHKEKDTPYDPVVVFFARWHISAMSRFRMNIKDFYDVNPWGHL